jgi:hypothetical protein
VSGSSGSGESCRVRHLRTKLRTPDTGPPLASTACSRTCLRPTIRTAWSSTSTRSTRAPRWALRKRHLPARQLLAHDLPKGLNNNGADVHSRPHTGPGALQSGPRPFPLSPQCRKPILPSDPSACSDTHRRVEGQDAAAGRRDHVYALREQEGRRPTSGACAQEGAVRRPVRCPWEVTDARYHP